jgi:hypothetical protein
MTWHSYQLDQYAHQLVLDAKVRDPDSLKQAYKMRQTVAYGLERFWGEQFRLQDKEQNKAQYWSDTWLKLAEIMNKAGITIPSEDIKKSNTVRIKEVAKQLWGEADLSDGTRLAHEDRQVVLAILTQFCDCLVWWTQRYQEKSEA